MSQILNQYKLIFCFAERKGEGMSLANSNLNLRSMYHMALTCCDNYALKASLLRTSMTDDASPARMKMMINLATKKNKYFASLAKDVWV